MPPCHFRHFNRRPALPQFRFLLFHHPDFPILPFTVIIHRRIFRFAIFGHFGPTCFTSFAIIASLLVLPCYLGYQFNPAAGFPIFRFTILAPLSALPFYHCVTIFCAPAGFFVLPFSVFAPIVLTIFAPYIFYHFRRPAGFSALLLPPFREPAGSTL